MSFYSQSVEPSLNDLNSNGWDKMEMKAEKDMEGYSFEAIDTKKSNWQMFWALAYVSGKNSRHLSKES